MQEERRDTLGRRIGNAGVPRTRRADASPLLPHESGVIGTGRNAVAYAWCERGAHFHIAPQRAYTREPMTARERAIVRFAPRTSQGTGAPRTMHYDPWDGTRRILPDASYVGSERHKQEQRERVRTAPHTQAHTCEPTHTERAPKCTCASFGGAPHTHRTDDGIDVAQAPRMTYAEVLARIAARDVA